MRILLILIFLLIACRCVISDKNYYLIRDIPFNSEYEVDIDRFPSKQIPIGDYYFRIPFGSLEETYLQVQFLKSDKINFKVKVSGFDHFPSDYEILEGIDNIDNIELEKRSVSIENKYIDYIFIVPTLKKQDKIRYLVVTILNNENLNYLSVYPYSSQSKQGFEFAFYNINYMKEVIFNETTLNNHKRAFILIFENEKLKKK